MGGRARSQTPRATGAFRAPDPARVDKILEVLQQRWGHATCELRHDNAYQLLVATILSAQSTDKRVNLVTPALFATYPDPAALAAADEDELRELIHSTGFFNMKARSLLGMARRVMAEFGGEIPRTMEALVTLPGVARKTANVVLGTVFGLNEGIAVDTHMQRVSQRLHLTAQTEPKAIERDLMALIPRQRWTDFTHQMIWHGRYLCLARNPTCDECPFAQPHGEGRLCPEARV
jgi:endonuclease III